MTYIDAEIGRAIADSVMAFEDIGKHIDTYSKVQGMHPLVMILCEGGAGGEPVALVHLTDDFAQGELLDIEQRSKVQDAMRTIGEVLGWRQ